MTKPPKKAPKKTPKNPAKKQALGRGLSALMSDISVPSQQETIEKKPKNLKQRLAQTPAPNTKPIGSIGIDRIERNPDQPRRYFDKEKLAELTLSIKDKGVLQPILVRPLPKSYEGRVKKTEGRYQIVAGERRWQAALLAGLLYMPVLVRELSDQEVLEIGVVENVQRADLNPIEEALAYQALKDQFGRTQEDISRAVGKSRPHVANSLRLLGLPELAREYLVKGKITSGHARAILAAPDQQLLAELIVANKMTVRESEQWVKKLRSPAKEIKPAQQKNDADSLFIEKQLSEHLGIKVTLNHKNPNGQLSIKYKTLEQLESLIEQLTK